MSITEVNFKAFCDKCNKEITQDIKTYCKECHEAMDGEDNQKEEIKSVVLFSALENIESEMLYIQQFETGDLKQSIKRIDNVISDVKLVIQKPEMLEMLVAVSKDFKKDHEQAINQLASLNQELSKSRQQIRSVKQKIEKARGDGRITLAVNDLEQAFEI